MRHRKACNHKRTIKFVESGYDMKILERERDSDCEYCRPDWIQKPYDEWIKEEN